MLKGKNVLLGVTASIAAYKSAFLCRLLIKEGANVKVLMTPESTHFIGPLTLSTLSKNPVYSKYYNSDNGEWTNHVDLAKWADFMLIAPLTANTMGKMVNGIADNLLLATYLSMENPVVIAPAMDLDMYKDDSTLKNIAALKQSGVQLIESEIGELASGLEGQGRMAEPEHIIAYLLNQKGKFQGKKVLISAGPTYEKIDAVRFIGNRSSGKMGIAIAKAFEKEGADVTLVLGPSAQATDSLKRVINVESAEEMHKEMHQAFDEADIVVMSAAVADYKIDKPLQNKMKKEESDTQLMLSPTIDILKSLGLIKKHQLLIGFALETDNELENAKSKLNRKNLDMIVLNSLNDKGAGFSTDTNRITIIDGNKVTKFELKEKDLVAIDILEHTLSLLDA